MKTLNEQINEIKNAKTTRTEKRFSLAKLGLIESDYSFISAKARTQRTFCLHIRR